MRTAIVSDLHLGTATGEDVAPRPRDPPRPARRDRRRRPPRPARRRRSSCAKSPSPSRSAGPVRSSRSSARRWRARGDARPRQPRPPLRRAAARAGQRRRRRPPRPRAHRAGRRWPDGDDRGVARPRPSLGRLPRHLAARRRLRDPRPLHGLPPDPAAARVPGDGDGDADLRRAPRAGRPRPTTRGCCGRSTASPTGSRRRGLAQRAHRPSERAWRAISGRRRPRGRVRAAAMRATIGAGFPAGIWALNRAAALRLRADLSAGAIFRAGDRRRDRDVPAPGRRRTST